MAIDPRLAENQREGMNEHLGVEIAEASSTRVVLRLEIDDRHRQPYGIVHGGLYCTLAETAASTGAALASADMEPGNGAVGVSNHTDFLRATRAGVLVATATPVHVGRQLQLWEVRITDAEERLAAHAKVRLFNVNRPPAGG